MRPQVVAHRGASHEHAEHTLRAYLRALEMGAEGLECDVRLTRDGHLVCVHDRTLARTGALDEVISTSRLERLRRIDVAHWKTPRAEGVELHEHDAVLPLRTLLETVADCGRPVELAIETKHPVRYGPLVEHRLVAMLREFGWERAGSPVRIMSFSWRAVRRAQRLAPELPVVMLIEKARHWPVLSRALGPEWILGPGIGLLQGHPAVAAQMVATGRDLHVWTVNTAAQLQTCLDLGVKAVISDRPDVMLELLDVRRGDVADKLGDYGEEVPHQEP